MDNLYDRLIELLHQKPDSETVGNFLREISEAPVIEEFGSIRSYHFPKHGFRFDSDVSFGHIWWICLNFDDAISLDGFLQDYQRFIGELPSQIHEDDRKESVSQKLGCSPVLKLQQAEPVTVPDLSDDELKLWSRERAKAPMVTDNETYYLPPYSLHFSFRISDGKLVSISMSKDRNKDSHKRKMDVLRRAGILKNQSET